ncbi:MAG: hypothetical protein HOH74_12570 [Gemmatimonadetes bacterium]|nr:hypothetical protein [Gemmatimonadota bacterium]
MTSVPNAADLQRLRSTADLVKADHCVLVSRTDTPIYGDHVASLDLVATIEHLLA